MRGISRIKTTAIIALSLIALPAGLIWAQGARMGPGMERGMGPGGAGMMRPMMDGSDMQARHETMHSMMESGMHGRAGMGRGMMAGHRAGGLFGGRVVPRMRLTVEDVRYHLERRLEMLGNDRLKIGSIKDKDDDTLSAEIVTVDDSLVQALEIDRHTGAIDYGS